MTTYMLPDGGRPAPTHEQVQGVRPGANLEGAQTGMFCHVFGLKQQAGMNGGMCRLMAFDTPTGRWRVSMIWDSSEGGQWYGWMLNKIPTLWPAEHQQFVKIMPDNLMLLLRKNIQVQVHSLVHSWANGALGHLTGFKTNGDCEIFLHCNCASYDECKPDPGSDYTKVFVNPRNVSPTIFIGSRVVTIIPSTLPQYESDHRREFFVTGYTQTTGPAWVQEFLSNDWIVADASGKHGTVSDKYMVPSCVCGEMVTLDVDNGPRKTAMEDRAHLYRTSGKIVHVPTHTLGEWQVQVHKKQLTPVQHFLQAAYTQPTTATIFLPRSAFKTQSEERLVDSAKHDPAHDAAAAPSFGKLQRMISSAAYRDLACTLLN